MATRISPLAGKPAQAAQLVDVDKLIAAYFDVHPDPSVAAQRVAFGTSGHRGCSFDGSFNEAHVLAITQAICLYRRKQGIDGPLFLGIDTHALSKPALRQRTGSAGGERRRSAHRARRRVHADAGDIARDHRLQPRPRKLAWPTAS